MKLNKKYLAKTLNKPLKLSLSGINLPGINLTGISLNGIIVTAFMLSVLSLCALSGCAEQVATVTDYANVTKDRSEDYKSIMLKPSLALPKEISRETCSETYRIP